MRPNYGIDAPGLVRGFLFGGLALLGASAFAFSQQALHPWLFWLAVILLITAIYALFMFSLMLWGSLVDKLSDREAALNLINWRGNERVLDVGCGRGLMLVGAAKRLNTGEAIGIDIWAEKDQAANVMAAPLENARLEGVSERVKVQTADMRKLPFADQSFDVVVSSWAVHNLELQADRMIALQEIVRLLRPSGAVLLTDIVNRHEYASAFRNMGLEDVRVVIFSRLKDRFLTAVSFGSFQPSTVFARKAKSL